MPGILFAKGYPSFDSSSFCTLKGSLPERPQSLKRCGLTQIPNVIAREIDVFPAKRGKVWRAFGRQ